MSASHFINDLRLASLNQMDFEIPDANSERLMRAKYLLQTERVCLISPAKFCVTAIPKKAPADHASGCWMVYIKDEQNIVGVNLSCFCKI